jgi:hypothetical protein
MAILTTGSALRSNEHRPDPEVRRTSHHRRSVGLEYLDSSGLGLLLSLSKEYGAQGGKLVLVTNETVDNILSLTRLNGIFSTAQTVDEAQQMVVSPA